MGRDMTYITQRDKALEVILSMADELLRLDAEVQALESEKRGLKGMVDLIADTDEHLDLGHVEQKVFEYGCEQLMSECFYTWQKVVQSSDTDEKTPCSFEQWRKSAFRYAYQPDWISVEQLYDVLDTQLRKLYAEQVNKFMEEEDDE